jgi:hypothetical protein
MLLIRQVLISSERTIFINILEMKCASSPVAFGAAVRLRGFGMCFGATIGRLRTAVSVFGAPCTLNSPAIAGHIIGSHGNTQ